MKALQDDPVLSLSGMLHDDLPVDVAEHFDRFLQKTFVAERTATGKRGRPLRLIVVPARG